MFLNQHVRVVLVFVKEKYLDGADVWLIKNACDVGERDKCGGIYFHV